MSLEQLKIGQIVRIPVFYWYIESIDDDVDEIRLRNADFLLLREIVRKNDDTSRVRLFAVALVDSTPNISLPRYDNKIYISVGTKYKICVKYKLTSRRVFNLISRITKAQLKRFLRTYYGKNR